MTTESAMCVTLLPPGHSGARRPACLPASWTGYGREPGIQTRIRCSVLDSGSPLFAASGMTAAFEATQVKNALALADLFQNLRRVLAEPRRRMLRRHRLSVHHDRCADAGDAAALGERARQIEQHAAMLDVRVLEHLVE